MYLNWSPVEIQVLSWKATEALECFGGGLPLCWLLTKERPFRETTKRW